MRDHRIKGESLRSLRVEAAMETKELAERIDKSPGFVRNIQAGSDQPSDVTASRIAQVLTAALGRQIKVEDFTEPLVLPRSPRQNTGSAA